VLNALDADGRDRSSLNRAEEHASQGIADCGAESPLKRLRGELAEAVGERLGIGYKALGFLEAFEHILVYLYIDARRPKKESPRRPADYFE
jgi:hypothetical protein